VSATAATEAQVLAALHTVTDPCMDAAGLDLSIVDLGLIGDIHLDAGEITIEITFTEVGCAFTHLVATAAVDAVEALDGVRHARLQPVWTPAWTKDRLAPRARGAFARARYPDGRSALPIVPTEPAR